MLISHLFLKIIIINNYNYIIIIIDIFCEKQKKNHYVYMKFLRKNNRTKWDTDLVRDFILY